MSLTNEHTNTFKLENFWFNDPVNATNTLSHFEIEHPVKTCNLKKFCYNIKCDLLRREHLNYYFTFDVCAFTVLSCLSFCKKKSKFGGQTSQILEFKPEGLESL